MGQLCRQDDSDDEENSGKWVESAEEEDWTLSKDSKVVTLTVPSMRADLLIKASLNMARK